MKRKIDTPGVMATKQRLYDAVKNSKEGLSSDDAHRASGMALSTAKSYLGEMYRDGVFVREKRTKGRSSWYFAYYIADNSSEPEIEDNTREVFDITLDFNPLLVPWGNHKTPFRIGTYYPQRGW